MAAGRPAANAAAPWADPPELPWSRFVRHVREAGCVTTNCDALRAFYDPAVGSCFHARRGAPMQPAVCCKPVALVSTRTSDCPSCREVWGGVMHRYEAEMALLRDHVTFVDGGDPLTPQVILHPYPLPLPFTEAQLTAMEDFRAAARIAPTGGADAADDKKGKSGEGKRSTTAAALPLLHLRVTLKESASVEEEMAARAALSPEAREDLLAHETALRRRAAYAAAHPPLLQTRQWEPYLRAAVAGQGEYVFRALFLFPHNGSVMRDVLNEDVAEGVDGNIHYFPSTRSFFTALKKSLRVWDDVVRHEVMAHCSS